MAHVGKVLFGIALLVMLSAGAYVTGVMVGPPPAPEPLPSSAETAPPEDGQRPHLTDRPASSPPATPTDTVATSADATHPADPQDGPRQERPAKKDPGKKGPPSSGKDAEKDDGAEDADSPQVTPTGTPAAGAPASGPGDGHDDEIDRRPGNGETSEDEV